MSFQTYPGKQPCFLCEGEGRVWNSEKKIGSGKECPACHGAKYIEDYYARCPHCKGIGKTYKDEVKKHFPQDCKLCNTLGYIDFVAIPCTYCETIGKIWKNPNKKGSGKECDKCGGNGYTPGEKLQKQQFPPQNQYPGVIPPQQVPYPNQIPPQGQFPPHNYQNILVNNLVLFVKEKEENGRTKKKL